MKERKIDNLGQSSPGTEISINDEIGEENCCSLQTLLSSTDSRYDCPKTCENNSNEIKIEKKDEDLEFEVIFDNKNNVRMNTLEFLVKV